MTTYLKKTQEKLDYRPMILVSQKEAWCDKSGDEDRKNDPGLRAGWTHEDELKPACCDGQHQQCP